MTPQELIRSAHVLGAAYRLSPPAQLSRGPAGVYGGSASGNSIDFHDFREYQPGDDLRRVDWRAYARTEQMQLKLYREEVSPVVEILPDTSQSMSVYPGKRQGVIFLCAFLAVVARGAEGRPVLLAGKRRWVGREFEAGLETLEFSGSQPPVVSPGSGAMGRPVRFFISDFLYPEGVEQLFSRCAAGALQLQPLLLLSASERDPSSWLGGQRLIEAEDERAFADIRITATEVARYNMRLRAHEQMLAIEASRHGGRLLALEAADQDLDEDGCAGLVQRLLREGVITAA